MKAPAGRPGLDVRRGGERAAAWGPVRRSAPRPAAATARQWRGPRAAGDQRAGGGGEGSPGRQSAGRRPGLHRLPLPINGRRRVRPLCRGWRWDGDGEGGRRECRLEVWLLGLGASPGVGPWCTCVASVGMEEGGGSLRSCKHISKCSTDWCQETIRACALVGAVYHFT